MHGAALKPRVLFSACTSWTLFNYHRNTFRAFLEAGYDVHVACHSDRYAKKLEALGCVAIPLSIRPASRNPFYELYTLLQFFNIYARVRPAAAFHFTIKCNLYGSLAARALGIPFVNSISGLGSAFNEPGLFRRMVETAYRLLQRGCFRVFFHNPSDLDYMLRRGMASSRQAFLLPGSGVDLRHFQPSPRPRSGNFVFVFAGRIIWEKGLAFLAEAMRIVQGEEAAVECRVHGFTGRGNPKYVPVDTLRDWESEGLIRYLDHHDDVREAFEEADCVVLPTYYGEGVPKSLLEAAAMAKPIVTTDLPGCRRAVREGENGFLCAPRDAESLAQAMLRMVRLGEAERARMGANGRSMVEAHFSEARVTKAYLDAADALTQ